MNPGKKVFHETYGVGTVCPRTAHTHYNYTTVFFPDDPTKKPGSKGVKRRVRTEHLQEMTHDDLSR